MPKFKGFSKYAYKPQKPGYHLHNFLNAGTFNPKAKVWFLGLAILIILVGGISLYQTPLFHSRINYPDRVFQQGPDPTVIIGTRLFHILLPGGALTEFNTFVPSGGDTSIVDCASSYEANSKCINMKNNSTHTVIALTKAATSLSSAASNNLVMSQFWRETSPFGGSTVNFGWYLTVNGTIPTTPGYDPRNDPSVFLMSSTACASGCGTSTQQINSGTWILRNIGDTLLQENLDCGPNAGALFFCNTQTYSVLTPSSNYVQLNYTGFTNIPPTVNCGTTPSLTGSGCSFQQNFSGTPTQNGIVSTTFLPPFKIQAHEFYYGLFIQAGTLLTVQFGTDNNNDDFCCGIKTFNGAEITNGVTTAGFFQPLVDALVASGIFIFNATMKFVAFIAPAFQTAEQFLGNLATIILSAISSVIIAVLNGLGSLIGDPNLGNQLVTLFTSVGSFITSLLSGIGALISTIITFIQDILTFFFDATNGLVTYWLGTIIFGIFGVLVTISNIIVTVLKLFQVGFPFIVLLDILWLLMESYDNGVEGALKWWTPHEILIVNVGKLIIMLIQQLSEFTYQTILAIEGGAADIKPEVAGFSP